jgi:DNA-binding transcriptional LysR family regulator
MKWTDSIAQRIKLRDLQIVLAVSKSGSMGRAAADLAVSQPAISKAISDLEYELGVRLFDRSPQGVESTIYGEAVLKSAAAIFDDLRQGMQAIEFLADPATGKLRIGTTTPLSAGFVPTVVDQLSKKYRGFFFDIVEADLATLLRKLRDRSVDLAIAPTIGLPPQDDMHAEVLLHDHHVPLAGAQSTWARRRKITWAEVVDEPWVLPPPHIVLWPYLVEAFHAAGIEPPRITVTTLSITCHHHLLDTGRFLTLLPATTIWFSPSNRALKVLGLELPVKPSPVAVLTLKNRTLSPAAKIFIDLARNVAKRPGSRCRRASAD